MLLVVLGCGSSCSPAAPPDETPPAQLPSGTEATADQVEPNGVAGCGFTFGPARAFETASGRLLPLNGGATDAASVVTIEARTATAARLVVLYQADLEDCATATFPHSVDMVSAGSVAEGELSIGVVPAFRARTHVCWKLAAQACERTLLSPTAASFDYTTK